MIYSCVFLLTYHLEQRVSQGGDLPRMTRRELLSAASMGLAAFLISNMSFVTANTPFTSSVEQEIANIRTLVDLAGVVILYAYHIQLFELHTRRELDAIKNILQNQYVQYRQSRESIDVINRKYHDLKHQIAVLRAEEDPARRSAFLDQMEEEIQHYEAQNKTGNSVLDTVLTGKSLYCAKHQIKLTCVADGARLSFMDVMDICTLFGNALDNAIECELSIPDKEKRLIHLEVYAKKDFLVIRCENYCPAPPRLSGWSAHDHQGRPGVPRLRPEEHALHRPKIRRHHDGPGQGRVVSAHLALSAGAPLSCGKTFPLRPPPLVYTAKQAGFYFVYFHNIFYSLRPKDSSLCLS